MYAGYQAGYYDEQQQYFEPTGAYAGQAPGYPSTSMPQSGVPYGYPHQEYYAATYGPTYDANGYAYDPALMPAAGGHYPAHFQIGMQQHASEQQLLQQYRAPNAIPPRPPSSTPSGSSARLSMASSGAASRSNPYQQQHQHHLSGTSTPGTSVASAQHLPATPASSGSPQSQPHAGSSSFGSLGGVGSLPPRPTFDPAAPQSGSSSQGPLPGHPSSGALLRPSPIPRLGGQPSQSRQQDVGSSGRRPSASHGNQLLEKLPALPPRPVVQHEVPPSLAWLGSVDEGPSTGGSKEAEELSTSTPAQLDADAKAYIASLHAAVQAYQSREEAMQLRVEAMAFRPNESWTALRIEKGDEAAVRHEKESETAQPAGEGEEKSITKEESLRPPASILGVRLLRKVVQLQKENEELGVLLSRKLNLTEDHASQAGDAVNGVRAGGDEKKQLLSDLSDAHSLLSSLSIALKEAEGRANKAEAALQVAVQSRSRGIMEASPVRGQQGPQQGAAATVAGGRRPEQLRGQQHPQRGGKGKHQQRDGTGAGGG
ncbi:hypothetical protein BDZ90DRAFT_14950 [Jaminaea rosea]|uniref:Uncharacterized protein n=1 Tax=Jaminaea rosea TaxID=1569628 RepID=A0A316V2Q8_9BASI|nr:hypothetical protein BDZ90DRAFT_14950 [Jaminaea rosea]PWN30463.1 hypothetical protein BDZ90DRAFT_14950 [Jaminaea rosea]